MACSNSTTTRENEAKKRSKERRLGWVAVAGTPK